MKAILCDGEKVLYFLPIDFFVDVIHTMDEIKTAQRAVFTSQQIPPIVNVPSQRTWVYQYPMNKNVFVYQLKK